VSPKPHFSPSQFNTAASCLRKWHYESVQGRRQPESEAMRRGTRIHRLLEVYVQAESHPLPTEQTVVEYTEQLSQVLIDADGKYISSKAVSVRPDPGEQRMANSALTHLPDPRDETMVAEGEFLLSSEHTGFGKPTKGFIDLWMPDRKTLVDYKTRSSDRYDKDEEELRNDPQCIIYAKVKMLEVQPDADGKRRVHFQHINIYTNGKRAAIVRLEDITEEEVERGLTRLRGLATRMLIAESLPVADVPVNLNACDRYGGCPFRVECGRHGLPVYGDNWQSRNAKAMAEAEGIYKSPQQLEEQMSGFASAFLSVNPPDGTAPDVVGNEAKHVEAEAAAVEARSERDEESHGEAPSEAPVEQTQRMSARDRAIQDVFDAVIAISADSHMQAFHKALGNVPATADDLRNVLQRKKLPELRKLLEVATTPVIDEAPIGEPTNLEQLAVYAATGQRLIAKGEQDILDLDKKVAELRAARNAAEEEGDDDKAETLSGEMKRTAQAKKDALDVLEKLRKEFSPLRLAELEKALTPAVAPPAVPEEAKPAQAVAVPETPAAPRVQPGDSKPFLLVRGQYIADAAHILHVETLLPKYHTIVAAAASVESIHEIKFEGPARVAALLAHDIKSGIIDLQKYTAISVPRRGANWDPIIDVLRPHVLAIFEGVG